MFPKFEYGLSLSSPLLFRGVVVPLGAVIMKVLFLTFFRSFPRFGLKIL